MEVVLAKAAQCGMRTLFTTPEGYQVWERQWIPREKPRNKELARPPKRPVLRLRPEAGHEVNIAEERYQAWPLEPNTWSIPFEKLPPGELVAACGLTEAATGLVFPVHPYINPGRSEWVPVPMEGLYLTVPEGGWRLDAAAPDGEISVHEVAVAADGEVTVRLE